MRSTFMGLEASKRGLFTQQSALYTTGHNISNANTQGYTRQRVNMETTPGFPGSGLNSPTTAGHIGTGVQAHSVQRIRDEFVDRQFRQETNKLGYWQSTTKSISQMEDVMSEPSEFGINQAFTEFWKSMEDVVTNPKDTAARQVMISKGQSLAESFNYMDTQLKLIQGNIGNEINVITAEANSLLKQIADLNKQIQAVEPNGYMPNDLYDTRDVLLDKLNEIMPVSVSYEKSGGNALAIAEGSMTITFKKAGTTDEITLVQGKEYVQLQSVDAGGEINGDVDDTITGGYNPFDRISVSALADIHDPSVPFVEADAIKYDELESSKGKILALVNAFGYEGSYIAADGTLATGAVGIYPDMLRQLDLLVSEFAQAFNTQHGNGLDLNGDKGGNFFETKDGTLDFTARNIKVLSTIEPKMIAAQGFENGSDVAAGTPLEEGNNKNLLALAKLQSTVQTGLQGGTFQSFYKSLIGDLGVKGKQAVMQEYNSGTLALQIENSRASHNSVSLDEEMTNMITFQQAYNANARMITVIDETLDKIINGMGRVGL